MVKVRVEVPPIRIGLVPKSLVMLGGLRTVREAVALPVEPLYVPPFVELTNPLMFGLCGHFIKGFANGVVTGFAEQCVVKVIAPYDKLAV